MSWRTILSSEDVVDDKANNKPVPLIFPVLSIVNLTLSSPLIILNKSELT